MSQRESLEVRMDDRLVGTLALTANHKVAFSYSEEWLEHGFSVSPFSLPLKNEVFVPKKDYFDGLFGVFADSLPDAWGQLLLERLLKERGKKEAQYSVLDRLAIVGKSGMGALTYHPQKEIGMGQQMDDLDELSVHCQKILSTQYSEKLDELYRLGGTSGGARPKIMTEIDGENWIIKFPAHVDKKDVGKMEYDYSLCAKACGIVMSETRLFSSDICPGYFGTKRFDRRIEKNEIKRAHMLTAAALLELDFNQPSLDYHELMKLTKILTRDCTEDVENMYRRMCFNVFAHNRDDHSKNFSFIYSDDEKKWALSPAYDLTYSYSIGGEHATTVAGNGKNPGMKDILEVANKLGMNLSLAKDIAQQVQTCVEENLGEFISKRR